MQSYATTASDQRAPTNDACAQGHASPDRRQGTDEGCASTQSDTNPNGLCSHGLSPGA